MGGGTCSKVWIHLSAGEAVEFPGYIVCMFRPQFSKPAGRIPWVLCWVCSSSTGSKCLEITSTLVSFLTRHCNELINVSVLQVWNGRKSLFLVSWGNKNQTKKQARCKELHGSGFFQRQLWAGHPPLGQCMWAAGSGVSSALLSVWQSWSDNKSLMSLVLPFLSCWVAHEELGLGGCCGNRQLCVLLLGEVCLDAGSRPEHKRKAQLLTQSRKRERSHGRGSLGE